MAAAPVWASLPALPRGDRRTWRRMDVGNNVLDQTLMGLNRFAEFGSVQQRDRCVAFGTQFTEASAGPILSRR